MCSPLYFSFFYYINPVNQHLKLIQNQKEEVLDMVKYCFNRCPLHLYGKCDGMTARNNKCRGLKYRNIKRGMGSKRVPLGARRHGQLGQVF